MISYLKHLIGGRFDKESLIGKRIMASDEVGKANIDEATVNDFKNYYLLNQFMLTVKEERK